MRERNIALGKLALELGLVTREAVSDAFRTVGANGSIAEELARRGLIAPQVARDLEARLAGGPLTATDPTWAATRQSSSTAPGLRQSASTTGSGALFASSEKSLLPEKGAAVGDYIVEELLGRGGMGAVFRGRHPGTGAEVAIKFLTAEDAPLLEERFEREMSSMARVSDHPGIVRIRTTGSFGPRKTRYVVMDFVRGGDLAARLKRGTLPLKEALHLVEKVSRALHHCHERGVIHRDLKPANILIRESDGEPLLTDFGIARDQSLDRMTKTGELMGTPAYMAPEQAEGKARDQDARTDIHALGVILFECLVGHPPYQASSSLGIVKKLVSEQPPDPCSLVPSIPVPVGSVILRCLEKERENRFPTALAFAEELERLRGGRKTYTVRRGASPVVLAAAAVGLVAVAGVVGYSAARGGGGPSPPPTGVTPTPTTGNGTPNPTPTGPTIPEGLRPLADGRYLQLTRALGREDGLDPVAVKVLAMGPDDRIAVSGAEGPLRIVPLTPQAGSIEIMNDVVPAAIQFSPRGKLLGTVRADGSIAVRNLGAPQDTWAQAVKGARATCLAFSSDERSLVTGFADGSIREWQVADGRSTRELEGFAGGACTSVALTTDGRTIGAGGVGRNERGQRFLAALRVDENGISLTRPLAGRGTRSLGTRFVTTEELLAVTETGVFVWDTKKWQQTGLPSDGGILGADASLVVLHTSPPSRPLLGSESLPGGQRFVVAWSDALGLFEQNGKTVKQLVLVDLERTGERATTLAVSRTGQTLAVGTESGKVLLFKIRQG